MSAASATPLCAALGRGALSTEEQGALSSLLETRSGVRVFVSAYVTGDEWAYADREAPAELVAALAAASAESCEDLVTSLATAAAASVDPESAQDSTKEQARRAAGRAALLVRALRPQLAALESSVVELQAAIERKEGEFDTSRSILDTLLEVRTRAMRLDESIDREGRGSVAKVVGLAAGHLRLERRPLTSARWPSGLQSRVQAAWARSTALNPLGGAAKIADFTAFGGSGAEAGCASSSATNTTPSSLPRSAGQSTAVRAKSVAGV
tara:strand:+ start:2507 stop:3310 length:804 start_codon:yes stop_codon:yes gene_type:complete